MSKWVNVKCVSVKEVMVCIKDSEKENDAIEFASEEMSDYEEFTAETVPSEKVEQYKRHADEIF